MKLKESIKLYLKSQLKTLRNYLKKSTWKANYWILNYHLKGDRIKIGRHKIIKIIDNISHNCSQLLKYGQIIQEALLILKTKYSLIIMIKIYKNNNKLTALE